MLHTLPQLQVLHTLNILWTDPGPSLLEPPSGVGDENVALQREKVLATLEDRFHRWPTALTCTHPRCQFAKQLNFVNGVYASNQT